MYNSEENIGGVVKFGVYSFVVLYVDDGRTGLWSMWGGQCSAVVERGYVGWTVGG